MNIVIMAGGGGSRLWPLSRLEKPKQFIDLGTGKTLLEHTYDRALALADPANIYIGTTKEYAKKIKELLPQVPAGNMFYEASRRDTGPALAAAAAGLTSRGKGAELAIFMWSDHVFSNEKEYLADLRKVPALAAANPQSCIILGHNPISPETTFGYIEAGEPVKGHADAFRVVSFKEKPDRATAEGYVASGKYFWNMGCVSLTSDFLLKQLQEHQPEFSQGLQKYEAALAAGNTQQADQAYGQLPKTSIDYLLLEKLPNIIAVTGDYGWNDVGNWAAVKDVFGNKGDYVAKGHHVHVDSQNNYVYNTTACAVSLIGLNDVIVVVTDDAILVTSKDHAHKVKDVVQKLEEDNRQEYL